QSLADSEPANVLVDIDGMLDGVAIAVEGAPVAVGGIARHLALAFRNDDRKAPRLASLEPLQPVLDIDQRLVPDRRRVLHGVVVDVADERQVGLGGVAQRHALVHAMLHAVEGFSRGHSARKLRSKSAIGSCATAGITTERLPSSMKLHM